LEVTKQKEKQESDENPAGHPAIRTSNLTSGEFLVKTHKPQKKLIWKRRS